MFRMVKRRVTAAELGSAANCHTFRASGITAYLLNGGRLERAQPTRATVSGTGEPASRLAALPEPRWPLIRDPPAR